MFEAIGEGFNNYANFKGRATRPAYWYFYLFYILATVFASVLDAMAGTTWIASLTWIALFIPLISAGARRMHDVGKSGWFQLIPIYNLYLFLQPTKADPA